MVLDRRRLPRLVLALAIAALAGCGIKGPLTLPDPAVDAKPEATKPASGSDRTAPKL
jgi:predicted small lipoprotein YifL